MDGDNGNTRDLNVLEVGSNRCLIGVGGGSRMEGEMYLHLLVAIKILDALHCEPHCFLGVTAARN